MRIIQEEPTLSTYAHGLQKRCLFRYSTITLPGCFLLLFSPCSWQQWCVSFYTSNGICSMRAVSASLHPSSEQHWQTGVNEHSESNAFRSYCAPLWTKRRKALPRASSSSSRDVFSCLVLQEGVMRNRRDVGWVGGLQHGSIFNQKKVANVAWYNYRRLKCAVSGRDRLERRKKKEFVHLKGKEEARDERGFQQACQSWNCILNLVPQLPQECHLDCIFVSRTCRAAAILI